VKHVPKIGSIGSQAMSNDPEWITAAIQSASKLSASVPDAVWTNVEILLRGKFSQRSIPPVELAGIARQLIEDMVPARPTAEGEK
jgi:hypothetical protein